MELPAFATSTYGDATSFFDPNAKAMGWVPPGMNQDERNLRAAVLGAIRPGAAMAQGAGNQLIQEKKVTARIVRVFIVDPNENLQLTDRVIYKSDEQLTDATDEELFFEANPAALLEAHNAKRRATLDKKASDRANKEVFLEPARIRDLRMLVVVVASF